MTKTIKERLDRIERQLFAPAPREIIAHDNAIGSVLHQRRKVYGRSMAEVKARGGPSVSFQSDVENGKLANVSVTMLIRWCAAIGCEPIMVFGDIVSGMKHEEKQP